MIYAHPETVIKSKAIRKILLSDQYQSEVCATVVDEVHMIAEWGDDFRKDFKRLGELTCMFPDVPHLALTATATTLATDSLCDVLQFDNVTKVICSPNRPNIYLERRRRLPNTNKYAKYDDMLHQIVPALKADRATYPVTVVYVESLDALGYAYQYTEATLGSDAYNPKSEVCPENRIFAQYHKDYTEAMKLHIVRELRKPEPKLRLIFATVALGMGLDAPSIRRVIHFQPPTTLEKYVQESGRAGRSGQPSHAILFFNNSDIASSRVGLSEHVKPYCTTDKCLRKHLVDHFGFTDSDSGNSGLPCCSNCDSG